MGGAFQLTGGSSGTTSSWDRYREAGARARAMLVAAAAAEWGVPASEITVVRRHHRPSERQAVGLRRVRGEGCAATDPI